MQFGQKFNRRNNMLNKTGKVTLHKQAKAMQNVERLQMNQYLYRCTKHVLVLHKKCIYKVFLFLMVIYKPKTFIHIFKEHGNKER